MRKALIGIAVLGTWLSAAPLEAGLYNSAEGRPRLSFNEGASFLRELREAPVPGKPGSNRPVRKSLLLQAEQLEEQLRLGRLSMAERADLGACYVRLGRIKEARRVLEAGDLNHFFIQANLATAYFVGGPEAEPNLQRALDYQQMALRAWSRPGRAEWAGWAGEQLKWPRRVELYYLKLLQARQKEALAPRARRERGIPLDPLFPTVKFVDPKRPYLPGELPPRVADELPPDAFNIVWELCLCAPGDLRLLWLLAEVLNASGQIEAAHALMDDIVKLGAAGAFDGLVPHRQVLARAKALNKPKNWTFLLSGLAPRSLQPIPGAGPMIQEVAAMAPAAALPYYEGKWIAVPAEPPPSPPPNTSIGGFTWRHITIGFVSGFLIAALVGMQWNEWRRRRQARPAPPPDQVAAAPQPAVAATPDTFQPASPDTFRPAGGR